MVWLLIALCLTVIATRVAVIATCVNDKTRYGCISLVLNITLDVCWAALFNTPCVWYSHFPCQLKYGEIGDTFRSQYFIGVLIEDPIPDYDREKIPHQSSLDADINDLEKISM